MYFDDDLKVWRIQFIWFSYRITRKGASFTKQVDHNKQLSTICESFKADISALDNDERGLK